MLLLMVGLSLSAEPFQPTIVQRANSASLTQVASRAGVSVDLTAVSEWSAPEDGLPFWAWMDTAAKRANRRVVLSSDGRRVSFVHDRPAPSAVDGAFRLAVRSVTCRHDYDAGPPVCEVGLDLHWEPRLAVVRVADTGVKVAINGALHRTTRRLRGIHRSLATLPPQEVVFTVTAAERMLAFTVSDLTTLTSQTVEGVTLTPTPVRRIDQVVELRFDLRYPDGHPEFESFETWTANNHCRLVHRDGRVLTTDDRDETHHGQSAMVAYRFRAGDVGELTGWSVVLHAPGPLRVFPVRFSLRDIPLP